MGTPGESTPSHSRLMESPLRLALMMRQFECGMLQGIPKYVVVCTNSRIHDIPDQRDSSAKQVTKTLSFTDSSEMLDGWVLGSKSELLFWVPPSLRQGLFWPNTHIFIGKFATTKLDLARFVHGESWPQCKE
jgi:hypothetical protein